MATGTCVSASRSKSRGFGKSPNKRKTPTGPPHGKSAGIRGAKMTELNTLLSHPIPSRLLFLGSALIGLVIRENSRT